MKKDVIYIDTEDDITTIIEKVKNAAAPIVALVPPKRIGVLQSIVNLKLLKRAASGVDKQLVLVTNDTALAGLAAGLALPVAKNLQSKPEIAPITALDSDDDDIINGEDLPAAVAAAPSIQSDDTPDVATLAEAGKAADEVGKKQTGGKGKKRKKGIGIPNFDSFRKKLFIFGGLGILLIAFLVWAIFFAPRATVAITAKTNVVNIAKSLQLLPNATVDTSQGILPVVTQQTKKTASVDFTPTGKKDVGEQATGTVKFTNSSSSTIIVAAGTTLTSSGGVAFSVDSAVSIPAATLSFSCSGYLCPGTASGTVTATNRGTGSNGVTGSLSGTQGSTTAALASATSGGTDKTVTVVTDDDVTKAKEQLASQDANTIKSELKKQFESDIVVVDEGFTVSAGTPTSSPAVGAEVTGSTAKLTAETTYTLIGVKRADLKAVYSAYLATQLKNDSTQKIYEYGENATQFSQFIRTEQGYAVRATAVAQVGPNIDDTQVAENIRGKRSGEVQQYIEEIQGIQDVNVDFWPFWVSRVPNDTNRITITFTLNTNDSN